jgi:hypothetical protein
LQREEGSEQSMEESVVLASGDQELDKYLFLEKQELPEILSHVRRFRADLPKSLWDEVCEGPESDCEERVASGQFFNEAEERKESN